MRVWLLGAAFALASGLAACQSSSGSAASAIEAYLQARVESNLDQMIRISCPEWEAQARIEATSFEAMNAGLEGVTCQDGGTEGNYRLVSCQGKIVTTYQGEAREWSVAEHPYKAILDDGEWRMCGYQGE